MKKVPRAAERGDGFLELIERNRGLALDDFLPLGFDDVFEDGTHTVREAERYNARPLPRERGESL